LAQRKKANKVGRPKLPKGEAKGRIVPVRFATDDLRQITAAAKARKQTLSEWIRSTLQAATQLMMGFKLGHYPEPFLAFFSYSI